MAKAYVVLSTENGQHKLISQELSVPLWQSRGSCDVSFSFAGVMVVHKSKLNHVEKPVHRCVSRVCIRTLFQVLYQFFCDHNE